MFYVSSAPDPFTFNDSFAPTNINQDTGGRLVRSAAINPAQKTLVLLSTGQSNRTNINPTLFTPTHASVIDNFNPYDGARYDPAGPLLGCQNSGVSGGVGGPGNVMSRVAENLVASAKYDNVILVPLAVGSTTIAMWASGVYVDRFACAMRRLASRGFVPGVAGLTFAHELGIGETDNLNGTTQADFAAQLSKFLANCNTAGFSGKHYVAYNTWVAGVTSSAIRAAITATANGTTIVAGADLDTITSGGRQVDNIHLSDTGAASGATLISNSIT